MLDEPRYGPVGEAHSGQASDETRNRWARHRLGRRLLDDPAGLSITAWLAARAATVPWHMDSSDYLAVPVMTAEPTITGPVPSTPWDTRLQSAVDRVRVPVYEEQIRERLFRAMDASGTR